MTRDVVTYLMTRDVVTYWSPRVLKQTFSLRKAFSNLCLSSSTASRCLCSDISADFFKWCTWFESAVVASSRPWSWEVNDWRSLSFAWKVLVENQDHQYRLIRQWSVTPNNERCSIPRAGRAVQDKVAHGVLRNRLIKSWYSHMDHHITLQEILRNSQAMSAEVHPLAWCVFPECVRSRCCAPGAMEWKRQSW